MNALWDGGVVALLDFEFAVLGPVEIDLCRLVCEALVSEDGQRSDNDAGADAFAIAAREGIQSTVARCSWAPRCSTSSAILRSGSAATGPRTGSKIGARAGCSPACSRPTAVISRPCSGNRLLTVRACDGEEPD